MQSRPLRLEQYVQAVVPHKGLDPHELVVEGVENLPDVEQQRHEDVYQRDGEEGRREERQEAAAEEEVQRGEAGKEEEKGGHRGDEAAVEVARGVDEDQGEHYLRKEKRRGVLEMKNKGPKDRLDLPYLANVVRHKGVEDALRVGRAGSSGGGGGGCACGTCGKVLLEAAEIIHTPTPPLLRLDDVLDVALVERVRPADDGHGGEPLVDANQVFSGKQKEGEGDGENCVEREREEGETQI